jgi:drug/metabolite transporter (DMT)-like permease
MTDITKGIAGGLGAGLAWAAISILARSLSRTIGPVAINALRSTIGGGLVLAVAIAAGLGGEILQMPLWAVLTLWASITIAVGIGDSACFASMESLGVTRALTVSMAYPLLTTLVGLGLLGETVTPPLAGGILLVLGGLLLITTGKDEGAAEVPGGTRRGLRLAFLAAGTWAVAAVLMKAPLQLVSVLAGTAVRSPMGGLVLWFTPWTRGTLRAIAECRPADRAALAAICLLSAASSVLFTVGIKYGGVAVGTVLSSTSPLFTIPFEMLVFGRRPSARTTMGVVATVAGIALMQL